MLRSLKVESTKPVYVHVYFLDRSKVYFILELVVDHYSSGSILIFKTLFLTGRSVFTACILLSSVVMPLLTASPILNGGLTERSPQIF